MGDPIPGDDEDWSCCVIGVDCSEPEEVFIYPAQIVPPIPPPPGLIFDGPKEEPPPRPARGNQVKAAPVKKVVAKKKSKAVKKKSKVDKEQLPEIALDDGEAMLALGLACTINEGMELGGGLLSSPTSVSTLAASPSIMHAHMGKLSPISWQQHGVIGSPLRSDEELEELHAFGNFFYGAPAY